jgi:hypothetical protein
MSDALLKNNITANKSEVFHLYIALPIINDRYFLTRGSFEINNSMFSIGS